MNSNVNYFAKDLYLSCAGCVPKKTTHYRLYPVSKISIRSFEEERKKTHKSREPERNYSRKKIQIRVYRTCKKCGRTNYLDYFEIFQGAQTLLNHMNCSYGIGWSKHKLTQSLNIVKENLNGEFMTLYKNR